MVSAYQCLQCRRVRIRLGDIPFQLNNYKLKRITSTFYTYCGMIRSWTPWTCNYITEILISWLGIQFYCIKCILTIIKFTTWHIDISFGKPIIWSYQILTINTVMEFCFPISACHKMTNEGEYTYAAWEVEGKKINPNPNHLCNFWFSICNANSASDYFPQLCAIRGKKRKRFKLENHISPKYTK